MKNKWLNIILIICMIIMQRVVIQMSGYEVYQLPFASTLFIVDNPTSNLVQILYAYIPLPFVLFYFSGNAREITTGYGKLWLIRSYSLSLIHIWQVASFHMPKHFSKDEIFIWLNEHLPADIAVTDISNVPDRVHARYNAVAKTYVYTIHTGMVSDVDVYKRQLRRRESTVCVW